jgi:hypothetical protein
MQQEKYRNVSVAVNWIVIASGSAFYVLASSIATFNTYSDLELEYLSGI